MTLLNNPMALINDPMALLNNPWLWFACIAIATVPDTIRPGTRRKRVNLNRYR